MKAFRCVFVTTLGTLILGLLTTSTQASADSGEVTYAVGNCYIVETDKGFTLFERSGGATPEEGQAVSGVLHDYGYQQLYDGAGKELFVGWIVDWGKSEGKATEDFRENCR